jgi:hypothetical protein
MPIEAFGRCDLVKVRRDENLRRLGHWNGSAAMPRSVLPANGGTIDREHQRGLDVARDYSASRAYSISITLSSSFLKRGAGWRRAWPGGRALGAQVPMAPVWSYVSARWLRVSS